MIERALKMNKLVSVEAVTDYTQAGGCGLTCFDKLEEILVRVNAELVAEGLLPEHDAYRIGANSVVSEDAPPEMTVFGIPGRILREERKRISGDGRIELEHRLIPDPVVDAMAALIDRIDFLEARLAHLQNKLNGAARAEPQRSLTP